MKILFLHSAIGELSAEDKVHATLASFANPSQVESHFIWQTSSPEINAEITSICQSNPIEFFDFGRSFAIVPKPKKIKRLFWMMKRYPAALQFLEQRVNEIKPDLIYTSQQTMDVWYARNMSKRCHIPHVIHLHYTVGPWLSRYALNALRKTQHIIAVSEFIRQSAMLRGIDPGRITTLLNPVDCAPFERASAPAVSMRSEFGWPEDTPVVLAVGRLDAGKGHAHLFEAFAQVEKVIPQARLLLCGKSTTRYEPILKERLRSLGLESKVCFAGQRSDIPLLMKSADVFCLPTELEPCALVFLEAMAAGLPVVSYYSGGNPELIANNETGFLCYPNDIQGLASRLVQMIGDPALARRMGEAGKRRAAEVFSPAPIAEKWVALLQSYR